MIWGLSLIGEPKSFITLGVKHRKPLNEDPKPKMSDGVPPIHVASSRGPMNTVPDNNSKGQLASGSALLGTLDVNLNAKQILCIHIATRTRARKLYSQKVAQGAKCARCPRNIDP